jgi:ribose 5-phosphate isomerase A
LSPSEELKRRAATAALEHVQSGTIIGLGTGSTMRYVLEGLGHRLAAGTLSDLAGVPTSEQTAAIARGLGIPLTTLEQHPRLAIAIDGADEIDPALNLIKGLGGALLREKIVAAAADRLIIVADESKLVRTLGERCPVPVEVVAFAVPLVRRRLEQIGRVELRLASDGRPLATDQGNQILDCHTGPILDPGRLDITLHQVPGVVEHGLFLHIAALALIARADGTVASLAR